MDRRRLELSISGRTFLATSIRAEAFVMYLLAGGFHATQGWVGSLLRQEYILLFSSLVFGRSRCSDCGMNVCFASTRIDHKTYDQVSVRINET